MEPVAEPGIDLFAKELPSMDEIKRFSEFVHSSESNQINFIEQLEDNMSKGGQKASLATGIGLFIVGRYAEAIKKLQKGKDCKEKYIYLAFALRRKVKFDEAIENLERSVDYGADALSTTLEKAAIYRYASEFEAAAKALKTCSNFENVSAEYHCQLARLQEAQGLYEEAMDNYKAALELSPNHQRAILFKKDIESTKTMFYDEEKEEKKTRKNQILETPISDFELSVRSRNCLRKMSIITLGDLLNISEAELLSYKNFGETSLREIKALLETKSLHLGMALEEKQLSPTEISDLSVAEDKDEQLLNKPIDDLQLSVRARKCLQKLEIRTLDDLTRRTEAELLGCKNFGVTSLNEIEKSIGNLGLSLRTLD